MQARQTALEEAIKKLDADSVRVRQQLVRMTQATKSYAARAQKHETALANTKAAEQAAHDKRIQVCAVVDVKLFVCCCTYICHMCHSAHD
jgi:hypothetical protein